MRIVGGSLSGRRFRGPPGDATRPTSERVREALASALEARGLVEGRRVLELYAGTGALSFEALSRGARDATLVERDARVHAALATSARELGLAPRVEALRLELGRARSLERLVGPYGLVFADPPYAEIDGAIAVLDELASRGALADGAVVVLEHARRAPPRSLGQFAPLSQYEYGDTSVVFLTRAEQPAP